MALSTKELLPPIFQAITTIAKSTMDYAAPLTVYDAPEMHTALRLFTKYKQHIEEICDEITDNIATSDMFENLKKILLDASVTESSALSSLFILESIAKSTNRDIYYNEILCTIEAITFSSIIRQLSVILEEKQLLFSQETALKAALRQWRNHPAHKTKWMGICDGLHE